MKSAGCHKLKLHYILADVKEGLHKCRYLLVATNTVHTVRLSLKATHKLMSLVLSFMYSPHEHTPLIASLVTIHSVPTLLTALGISPFHL